MATFQTALPIDYIIGMPPITTVTGDPIHTQRSSEAVKNTMPVATIYPGIPSFEAGIDLFTRVNAFEFGSHRRESQIKNVNTVYYQDLLIEHGYRLDTHIHSGGVKVAYIADNFPTDTFTNEYGENFLQSLTSGASEAAASIAQMFGKRDVRGVLGGLAGAIGEASSTVGDFAKGTLNAIDKVGGALASLSPNAARMGKMVSSLAAGSRIDFPMVWKSSSFQPSYSMTVRLYNPNPGDPETTKKYIIGPIAALMLLGIPISEDGSTYSWPYLHRVSSPGIYDLDPAYIQNITIVKGGDQQQIAYTQSLGVVDVRIDFGSLFSSMLASKDKVNKTRPTLRKYLSAMENRKTVYNITGGSLKDPKTTNQKPMKSEVVGPGRNQQAWTKSQAILDAQPPEPPPDRVTQTVKDIGSAILEQIPKGFRISTTR